MKKSTLLHLRIPFSVFLMPVFLFALSQSTAPDYWQAFWAFVAIHLFLYPASNAYNSYFDKDEESIGGLEKPPPVSKELYTYALLFDAAALLIAFFAVNFTFTIALLLYGLASKAYSHPAIRLKKYPIYSWLWVAFFQGFFTYTMSVMAIEDKSTEALLQAEVLLPGLLSSLLLMASYPMTQVYQHAEDARRGDRTLSLLLGLRGTFLFSAVAFLLASAAFVAFFMAQDAWTALLIFQLMLFPTLLYFLYWWYRVRKDPKAANFKQAMRLNALSSLSLSFAFILMWWIRS